MSIRKDFNFTGKQKLAASVLTAAGILISSIAGHMGSFPAPPETEKATESGIATDSDANAASRFANPHSSLLDIDSSEDAGTFHPAADKLNLAYFYADDADESDVLNSYAGEVYRDLMREDEQYIAKIYDLAGTSPLAMAKQLGVRTGRVMGKYNPNAGQDPGDPSTWAVPEFKRVNITFYDADGNQVNEYSNVKDIMAMASVYCFKHNYLDHETFSRICHELYEKSHSYRVSIGSVYYDDGCIHKSIKEEAEEAEEEEKQAENLSRSLERATAKSEGLLDTSGQGKAESSYAASNAALRDGETDAAGREIRIIEQDGKQYVVTYEGERDENGRSRVSFTPLEEYTGKISGNNGADTETQSASGKEASTENPQKETISASGESLPESTQADPSASNEKTQETTKAETSKAASETGSTEASFRETTQAGGTEAVSGNPESSAAGSSGDAQASGGKGATGMRYQGGGSGYGKYTTAYRTSAGKASSMVYIPEKYKAKPMSNTALVTDGSKAQGEDQNAVTSPAGESGDTTLTKEQESGSVKDEGQTVKPSEESGNQNADNAKSDTAHVSGAESEDISSKNYCPGHIDLNISVTLCGFDDEKGLRAIDLSSDDALEAMDKDSPNCRWFGWDQENIASAEALISQDWFTTYGLTISALDPKKPLTQEEISAYLSKLPEDISEDRKKVLAFALGSVGKIPYYWGGKASRAGYDGNGFGSVTDPDYKGRILRGLDCSGWVQWVYWSAIGNRLEDATSTSVLIGLGERINRADLKPGDIIVRVGTDSHVLMFLQWSEDGKMVVIHENSASNNVSVDELNVNYPYYRKLIE